MYQRVLLASVVTVACSSSDHHAATRLVPVAAPGSTPAAHADCAEPVSVFDRGREQPPACSVPATTPTVDLRAAWTPVLFAVQPDGTAPEFRPSYLALAREQGLDGKPLPPNIGLTELYGIVPSFAIVRARFGEAARYACRAKIDPAPLAKLTRPYGEELAVNVKLSNHQRDLLGAVLERVRVQRNLADYAPLAPARELGVRCALRVLRERVGDATGLIEDGTAGKGEQAVLGRMLDPVAMRTVHGQDKPLANAAPDLISAATEPAAKELGWTDPAATAAFLAKHPGGLRVALALPAPPAYHAKHMDLSAEIDRGDVWYDEQPVPRVAWRRPALIVYAQDRKTKRPLVRWPTTIGGGADVRSDGNLTKRWKESDVGPREWRQLYAAPTWLPPDTTPDDELVRWVAKGKWELKKSIMGPGPLSAFGMIRLPHERAIKMKNGSTQYVDNGIGTHGSAVVTSLLNGTSHGCHRLYNHMAIRLGGFLLDHRDHVVRGQQPEHFRRTVNVGGTFHAQLDTCGFMYELTPPVHIDVLPGTIRSERKVPPADAAPAGAD